MIVVVVAIARGGAVGMGAVVLVAVALASVVVSLVNPIP